MRTRFMPAAALLLSMFATAFAYSQTHAPSQPFPRVVAKVSLKNQTAPIPNTTIFTPSEDGLYRISPYIVMTTLGNTQNFWSFDFFWTDDAGAESLPQLLVVTDSAGGYGVLLGSNAPVSFAFRAVAGQPVSYDTSYYNGSFANGTYALFFVVERLE